tara:strand:- start:252 stop:410 length:159 start_codon:yes stop_codon:yes gene_type:complete
MAHGAGKGNRTPTPQEEPDFESGASTSFAIPALKFSKLLTYLTKDINTSLLK